MAKRIDAANRSDSIETLAELALGQDGFFAASQAAARGIDRHQIQRLVPQRLLERDQRRSTALHLFRGATGRSFGGQSCGRAFNVLSLRP